jgi:hypothetical protein
MLMFDIYLCFYNLKCRGKGGGRNARGVYFPHRRALMSGQLGFDDFIDEVTRETVLRGRLLNDTTQSGLV